MLKISEMGLKQPLDLLGNFKMANGLKRQVT